MSNRATIQLSRLREIGWAKWDPIGLGGRTTDGQKMSMTLTCSKLPVSFGLGQHQRCAMSVIQIIEIHLRASARKRERKVSQSRLAYERSGRDEELLT